MNIKKCKAFDVKPSITHAVMLWTTPICKDDLEHIKEAVQGT
jgi:hypothetical protein